jgi:hypothetical protein
MGGSSSSVSSADINNLKGQISELQRKTSDYNELKAQLSDASGIVSKTLDYEKIAKKITDVSDYNQKLADAISKNPGSLGEGLAKSISSNQTALKNISSGLQDNTTFAQTLSSSLTNDAAVFRSALRGDKGPPGEISKSKEAVKAGLYDSKYTMWCADGDFCKLPDKSKGIDWGYGGSKIYDDGQLNIESDDNIYFKTDKKNRMTVNNNGVSIDGNLKTGGIVGGDDGTTFITGYGGMYAGFGDWGKMKAGDTNAMDEFEKKAYGLTRNGIKLGDWKIETDGDRILFKYKGTEKFYFNNKDEPEMGPTFKDGRKDIIIKGKDYNINNRNWGTLKSHGDKGVSVRDGGEGNWTNWRIE